MRILYNPMSLWIIKNDDKIFFELMLSVAGARISIVNIDNIESSIEIFIICTIIITLLLVIEFM